MDNSLVIAIISAAVTGLISTATTVVALRVHIIYIRETLTRHEKSINRAHERLDEITNRLTKPE